MNVSDLFGGLSGLMRGFSGFMPQDDPDIKLINAQSELNDLKKQEAELYAQIGKRALEQESGRFPELESNLQLVQRNILAAAEKLKSAQTEKDAKEAARRAQEQEHTCPSCGNCNPGDVKFCQECGAKLGATKCSKCGIPLPPGTRFCGECGMRQEG